MSGKSTGIFLAAALLFAVFGAMPTAAQEQEAPQTAPASEAVAPAGEVGAESEEEDRRRTGPEMQRLFFSAEQRRVLEALRQGLVESELLESDDFVPVVLREEAFIASEEEEVIVERGEEALHFTGMVRRNSDGKAFVWINGEQEDVGEGAEYLDKVRNLVLTEEQTTHEGITGIDTFTRRRFKILIGQSISTDGQIREDLPVVEVNKKN